MVYIEVAKSKKYLKVVIFPPEIVYTNTFRARNLSNSLCSLRVLQKHDKLPGCYLSHLKITFLTTNSHDEII